jgi:hypothetical protein
MFCLSVSLIDKTVLTLLKKLEDVCAIEKNIRI